MMDDDDFPRMGINIRAWSDLDDRLPKHDLDVELFRRNNVWIASSVVIASLLKGDRQQQQRYFSLLTPAHFDSKSLVKYLFEKIALFPQENIDIPVPLLESWVPQYMAEIWGESPPNERMLYSNHATVRQILSFNPTEEQVIRAIDLRKRKMEDREKYGKP